MDDPKETPEESKPNNPEELTEEQITSRLSEIKDEMAFLEVKDSLITACKGMLKIVDHIQRSSQGCKILATTMVAQSLVIKAQERDLTKLEDRVAKLEELLSMN
jgi:hypothetical protein